MLNEFASAQGVFSVECYDQNGNLKWTDTFHNVVTTVGKNLALDSYLGSNGGSAPGGTGPYMGLINASGFTAVSVNDTMGSHIGWSEYTSYTGTRKTCLFNSASAGSKALSVALQFLSTAVATIQGAFIVYGPSASATLGNTSGTLYSAGAFALSQGVNVSDSLYIAYVASL